MIDAEGEIRFLRELSGNSSEMAADVAVNQDSLRKLVGMHEKLGSEFESEPETLIVANLLEQQSDIKALAEKSKHALTLLDELHQVGESKKATRINRVLKDLEHDMREMFGKTGVTYLSVIRKHVQADTKIANQVAKLKASWLELVTLKLIERRCECEPAISGLGSFFMGCLLLRACKLKSCDDVIPDGEVMKCINMIEVLCSMARKARDNQLRDLLRVGASIDELMLRTSV
jgi:hypothetical protein